MLTSKIQAVVARLTAVGCVVLAMTGCGPEGPPRAAVSGRITLDGAPLEIGVIRFIPIDGTPGQKMGIQVHDGVFEATAESGPAIGSYRIEIESTDTADLAMNDEVSLERVPSGARIQVVSIPSKYNTHSRLTARVEAAGDNELLFELYSKTTRR